MPTKKESTGSGEKTAAAKPRKTSARSTAPAGVNKPSGAGTKKTMRLPKRTSEDAASSKASRATKATKASRATKAGTNGGKSDEPRHMEYLEYPVPMKSREPLTHEQIAVRAYYIAEQWRAEGRDTSDEGVWLEAERQMRAERGWNS